MNNRLIVLGENISGKKFRPSDWVERLASCFASFLDTRRLHYHSKLFPVVMNNNKCLSMDLSLENSRPDIWSFVMGFALENNLKTVVQHDEIDSCPTSSNENENIAA